MPPKKPSSRKPLTPGEEAFVAEYVANGCNAARAYMVLHPKVGYASARTLAARTLAKVDVRAAVRREQGRVFRKSGVSAERVLRELAALAFTHVGEVIDPKTRTLRPNIPPEAMRAIASIEQVVTGRGRAARLTVKVRMHPKGDALDKLCRHMGLYRELPPLETVLGLMPPHVAAALREELARGLPVEGSQPGAVEEPLPEWVRSVLEVDECEGTPAEPMLPACGNETPDAFPEMEV